MDIVSLSLVEARTKSLFRAYQDELFTDVSSGIEMERADTIQDANAHTLHPHMREDAEDRSLYVEISLSILSMSLRLALSSYPIISPV